MRRNLLNILSKPSGGGNCDESINFQIYTAMGDIETYVADGCMTWEQLVNSKYNVILPDGKTKTFFIKNDPWGVTLVWHNIYIDEITIENRYIWIPDLQLAVDPQDKIIADYLYYAD